VPGNTTADCLTHIDLLVRVSKTMRTQWSFIFLASLPERQLAATISNGLTGLLDHLLLTLSILTTCQERGPMNSEAMRSEKHKLVMDLCCLWEESVV